MKIKRKIYERKAKPYKVRLRLTEIYMYIRRILGETKRVKGGRTFNLPTHLSNHLCGNIFIQVFSFLENPFILFP